MAMPEDGPYYSVNQSYYSDFTNEIKNFISYCVDQKKMLRYIGSMVADIHRTICLGGVFMYPSTSKNISGKLRMLYECNPLSFIVEQAGGVSINEQNERILDIEISELHQRSPIIIGSKKLVDKAASFR